ncbi:MAG: TIGR00270 family protein [Desulfurococcales archaeon]|nr:TIGR00270 family protein [Desulfurococcales archaeon]
MPYYCELCGREILNERLSKTVVIEGAVLRVCMYCYNKLMKQGRVKVVEKTMKHAKPKPVSHEHRSKWTRTRIPRKILEEEFEVVSDYSRRVREARQRLGWSTRVLAEKVREKENVIKRIEAGRLIPSIPLARKLEKVLHIKLLEPIVDETPHVFQGTGSGDDYFTIGDLIKIKTSKK